MNNYHDKHFPNETEDYRAARNELLQAEINLRRQTEAVAALRRNLPNGGKLKEDYVFEELDKDGKIKQTKFSELFTEGKDTLIIYSFMFSPLNESPCVACSSIIDGINGMVHHVQQRVNMVAVTRNSVEKMQEWINKKGWHDMRFLSSLHNSYNKDYFAEGSEKDQWPNLNVFRKTDDGIFHFYSTELLFTPADKGQNSRHVDTIWPIWNLFDYTPEGRGENWFPKHEYKN